jgi:hypothetical protein
LLGLAGPILSDQPPTQLLEVRGAFGFFWLVAVAWAYLTGDRRVRAQVVVCLLLGLFSVGGAAALARVPGFGLFRYPSRMLMIAALPVAYLAGVAMQSLFLAPVAQADRVRRCRRVLLVVAGLAGLLTGLSALHLHSTGAQPTLPVYWIVIAAALPVAYWLLGRRPGGRPVAALLWSGLLLIDLWLIAWPSVAVRPEEEIFPVSASVRWLAERDEKHGRVLDRDAPEKAGDTPLGAGAPLALATGLEPLRGFNPIDVRRYREYLQFVGDSDAPLDPLVNPMTFPVLGNFPVKNRQLLDLLGTRYLLQPAGEPVNGEGWTETDADPDPVAYNFLAGGVRRLPGFVVYRNETAFPRAFVVPRAEPLPPRDRVLEALRTANLRQVVYLEGVSEPKGTPGPDSREARIVAYRPNRVVVHVDPGPAGYLVLADVWYPGWTCRVDGGKTPLFRADYLFRAVELPEGEHSVTFTFAPVSYRVGRFFSGAALAGLFLLVLLGSVSRERSAN